MTGDPVLADRLERHGQGHLLRYWDELDDRARSRLEEQIAAVDLDRLDSLIRDLVFQNEARSVDPSQVGPIEVERLPHTDADRAARRRAVDLGETMLADGEVAAVMVAGGQGTRLGFDGPKGTYPIGPVTGASLFQIHAERLVAMGRRYGRPIPLFVMTSPENHADTARFFDRHANFGLERVRLFQQGVMPAVDRTDGRILMSGKDRLATSPDGHGGTLAALARVDAGQSASCLQEMRDRGIRTLFYFQVDNPLVQACDPAFLGLHRQADAEMSFKVVEKVLPDEKVGLVVRIGGRPEVIEYSDLGPELAERRGEDGRLSLWAGSIAIHGFELEFVDRLARGGELPFHRAVKQVRYLDADGRLVQPTEPNAVKFETFIFDALPLAQRWAIVETDRATEFEPLKNATGSDSPATVRQRMSDRFADWLETAGIRVMRRPDGSVPFGIEVSPLLALDAAELKGKVSAGLAIDRPIYLGPEEPGSD